jgi:predicted amidohydrolase
MKAGIVQFDVRLGDVSRNLETVQRHVASLAQQGVQMVLLPEMWSTGFANDKLHGLSESTPQVLEDISDMSRRLGMTIIGSLPEKTREGIYNTAYVVDRDGSIVDAYRKIHLFTPTGEDRHFLAGREGFISETPFGPMGLIICYDLRFPELSRSLVLQGARTLAVMAEWPSERLAHWDVLLKARAIENQVFVLAANRCGEDSGLVYAGHSRVISPYGEVMARAGRRAATLTATIDFSLLERTREEIPCLRDRMPEAYG